MAREAHRKLSSTGAGGQGIGPAGGTGPVQNFQVMTRAVFGVEAEARS